MASTDPLSGARIGDMNDAPLGGMYLAQIITDLRTLLNNRFPTQSARDAAYTAAGVTIKNGMSCWTDDAGFWDRTGGAWVLRTSPARLRLTATDDGSLSSTLHPFQIGPDSGINMVIDCNEIIPRNNGALSTVGFAGARLNNVGTPTGTADAATKGYSDGTSGTLSLLGGWAVLPNYHTPAWTLSSTGWVTLSGAVIRTGANFGLGVGTPFQFATLDPSLVPVAHVSPDSYAGLGTTTAQTYPCRIFCAGGSNALSVVGMDSGTGTIAQNLGYVNLDGVRWRI